MSFINPALLLGALLFAVPLIIHLLNRQRYKRREWAAMEFLLTAFKKQRRRLRTENLLLLLLRCLIPVVLALAIARPVLREAIGGGTLGGSSHHVLLLDHSYSMGLRPEAAQSPFARMKELAARLLEDLEQRSGAKVTLVQSGIRTAIPITEELNLARVKTRIASLTGPQDSAADLTEALDQIADLVEEGSETSDTVVYLFTDLQARTFGSAADEDEEAPAETAPELAPTPGEEPEPGLFTDTSRDLLTRIGEHAEIVVMDVGGIARGNAGTTTADNLQIADLALDTMVAVARNPVSVVATLHNRSGIGRTAQVTLEIDGGQPARKPVQLEAGAEGQVEFTVSFADKGTHHLRVSVEGDGLAADNERFLVVQVRDRIRLLIVEGSTENDPGLMDSEHLRAMLDPTRGEGPPEITLFAPRTIDTIEFLSGREDPQNYDLLVLANVERLNGQTATAIREAMLGGTSLLVMLGDRTDAASFNLHLHGVGDGPMPMQLSSPFGYQPGGDQFYESEILLPDHPVFGGFEQEVYVDAFQLAPVFRFFTTTNLDPGRGRVLARLRDQDLSPLLITSDFGAGKALFLTSPISQLSGRWNRLDLLMLALPFFHESVRWLTLPATDPYNVDTGADLAAELRQRPVDVAVLLPERAGGGKVLVAEDSRALPGNRYTLPPFRQTEFAGIYTVEMQLDAGGASSRTPHRELFAANVDPAEGDLTYLSHEATRERLGVNTILRQLPSESSGPIKGGSSDLGLLLLYAALAFVLSEASLARLVSRRRSA